MKLSIDQVAKLTKLSVQTIRVYASRQHLGTKVGNKRMYSQSDVQKLLKGSSKNKDKGKHKVAPQKIKRTSSAVKAERKVEPKLTQKKPQTKGSVAAAMPEKRSFWGFLRPRSKQQKVSLLQLKSSK